MVRATTVSGSLLLVQGVAQALAGLADDHLPRHTAQLLALLPG